MWPCCCRPWCVVQPLMDAVRHGHSDVQQLLLRYGGLLKMDPVELGAMLCTAAADGDRKTLETLVQNGADINQGEGGGKREEEREEEEREEEVEESATGG